MYAYIYVYTYYLGVEPVGWARGRIVRRSASALRSVRSRPCRHACSARKQTKRVESGYWRLHDIASPIVYGVCHTKGGSVGGAYIAQWSVCALPPLPACLLS